MSRKIFSYTLVTIQLGCITAIFLSTRFIAQQWWWLLLEILALVLGLSALYTMRPGNFNAVPNVKENAILVRRGVYKFIRHPMYTSVLLASIAVVFDAFTLFRFSLWLLLLIVLLVKLHYEEQLLLKHFPEYRDYQKHTKKLIPYVL